MTAPNATINLSATVSAASGTIAIGDVLVPVGGVYVKATTANLALAAERAHGIALTAWSSSVAGSVQLQHVGIVDPLVSGLAAGTASWLRVSTAGRLERCTPSGSDDVVGRCAADGTAWLTFGLFDANNYAGGGGGGFVPPTGTGFVSVTAGALDGASIKVPLGNAAYVSGTLPVANGGTGITAVGAGIASWWATPSGANLAAAMTSALPDTKGGTGLTALASGVANFLGTPSGANLASALTTALPVSKGGTNRTALGTALQVLRTNAGATDTEWATSSAFSPPSGTGFVSVTAGVLDAASIKVPLGNATYVSGTLAVANGGTGVTSSTGATNVVLSADPVITSSRINNATAGGTINNCTLASTAGSVRRVYFTNASGPTVTGFDVSGTSVGDGTILRVTATGGTVSLTHEDAGSTAANRITLQAGITVNLPAGCVTMFEYDGTNSRWRHLAATAI